MEKTKSETSATALAIGSAMGSAIGGAFAAAGAKITDFFQGTIGSAMELARVNRIVGLTFGDVASKIDEQGKAMAHSAGTTQVAVAKFSQEVGMIALKANWSREAAQKWASQMVELAAQMQSADIHGRGFAEVAGDLSAGLMGATRGLKDYGMVNLEAEVDQEAMRLGMVRFGKDLSDEQMQIARSMVIMKEMKFVQGDLASLRWHHVPDGTADGRSMG